MDTRYISLPLGMELFRHDITHLMSSPFADSVLRHTFPDVRCRLSCVFVSPVNVM